MARDKSETRVIDLCSRYPITCTPRCGFTVVGLMGTEAMTPILATLSQSNDAFRKNGSAMARVFDIRVKPGDQVSMGQTLMTLAD